MPRVLIVSPRFPPTNAADMHRVRQGLPYFRDGGWEPVVLAVEPAGCEAPVDPLLERTVPGDVRVFRTPAIDIRTTRRFGLGDLALRALPHLARAGDRLLAEERFDLVYFSTTAFPVTALGPRWARRHSVPFVMDLQDPWRSDYYGRPGSPSPPGGRLKYGLSQGLARVLEPQVMREVSHAVSVSPAYPETLTRRYPWMRSEDFTVLPFGAPGADFELLRREPVRQSVFDPSDGLEHWVYAGRAGGAMELALTAFFTALRSARERRPGRLARLRLHFVGTDYASGDRARKTVEPLARAAGVGDLVEERPHRIPYFEALQCLLDADALVVPGSDDPGYTASKLYPYILAGRPMLCVFHEESSVVDIVRRTRAGTVVPFGSGEGPGAVARRIGTAWFEPEGWARPPAIDREAFEPYTAREMTRRQCEVFDRVIGARRGVAHAG